MLHLEENIGHGASRQCYVHPEDPNKCVKVPQNAKALKDIRREIMINVLLRPLLRDCIPECEEKLAETDKGQGMVCELIRDFDGRISLPVTNENRTAEKGFDARALAPSLDLFVGKIIENDIFFYDFNKGNFVFQRTSPDESRMVYVDMKSLGVNGYPGFLKLEKFIAPLARIIMFRRVRRFYRETGFDFPFDELCRKKMFDGFRVTFRPSLRKWERERGLDKKNT